MASSRPGGTSILVLEFGGYIRRILSQSGLQSVNFLFPQKA